jgi:hypothetical protein
MESEGEDNDMDLLDDDDSSLIKDRSPSPTGMDINLVFTLPTEFRGVNEDIAQLCLGPKAAMFKKPDESSQHLKPPYIAGHIDGRSISKMLIDDDAAINPTSYSMFKKLRREDNVLMKTNLTLNGVGATRWRIKASSPWSPPWGASHSLLHPSLSRCKVSIVSFLVMIGFTPIIVFMLLCINS